MRKNLTVLVLFFTLGVVRADLILQQKVESSTKGALTSSDQTIKIKGSKIRVDNPGGELGETSMIKDEKTGEITVLIHQKKMVAKQKEEAANPTLKDRYMPAKPQDTGKAEKVGGFDARIYTWASDFGTTSEKLWVAKNFPNYEIIRADLPTLEKVNNFGNTKADQPDISKLPGMVVKSIRTEKTPEGSEQTTTTTLISAKVEPIDASIFEAPSDYKEAAR